MNNDDIHYYKGAIENKLLPLAKALIARGQNVTFLLPDTLAGNTLMPPGIDTVVINSKEFNGYTGILSNLDEHLYAGDTDKLKLCTSFYLQNIAFQPDVVIAWENELCHLKSAYPDALMINLMPGFASRLPYPDLVFFDTNGLFKNSDIYTSVQEQIDSIHLTESDVHYIDEFRSRLGSFFNNQTWVKHYLHKADNFKNFSTVYLLPLQYSKHFAFKVDCSYESQFEMLIDVLNKIPSDIGVVVTQYVTNNIAERAVTEKNAAYLAEKYPNLIFVPDFDKIDNISQYLLSQVDTVVTSSSSLALQALLFEKNVKIINDSFLKNIIDVANSSTLNRYKVIHYLLFQKNILFSELRNPDNLLRLIHELQGGSSVLHLDTLIENYGQKLIEHFRFKHAGKKLIEQGVTNREQSTKILEIVGKKIQNAEIVSFDIFETLIERPLAQPSDLFILVERKIHEMENIPHFEFTKARMKAEKIAQELSNGHREEITLDEIYDVLATQYFLDNSQKDTIKQLELDLEYSLLTARPVGKFLYDFCKKIIKKLFSQAICIWIRRLSFKF